MNKSRYGEPWGMTFNPDWNKFFIHAGKVSLAVSNSNYTSSKDAKAEIGNRAIQCVNACAGIDDPVVMEREDYNKIRQLARLIQTIDRVNNPNTPLWYIEDMIKFLEPKDETADSVGD